MSVRIHTYETIVSDPHGVQYRVHAEGAEQADSHWHGWLTFEPVQGTEWRRTERETTQSKVSDLEYWAAGLEPIYLEGALSRAHRTEGRS